MLDHRGQFVGNIPNAPVVRDRDASVLAAVFEPLFVRPLRQEEVVVSLDGERGCDENRGELLAEVPIGEIEPAHAARSYRTASSISASVRP
jgi:hypothetical protein